MNKNILLWIIALSSVAGGLLHATLVATDHSAIWPEMAFFIVFGIAQIGAGVLLLKKQDDRTTLGALIVHGGLIVLWALTRMFPAPFINAIEGIRMLDIIVISLESIVVVGLIVLHDMVHREVRKPVSLVGSIIVAFFFGAGIFGIGHATDDLFGIEVDDHHHGEEAVDSHDEIVDNHGDVPTMMVPVPGFENVPEMEVITDDIHGHESNESDHGHEE